MIFNYFDDLDDNDDDGDKNLLILTSITTHAPTLVRLNAVVRFPPEQLIIKIIELYDMESFLLSVLN